MGPSVPFVSLTVTFTVGPPELLGTVTPLDDELVDDELEELLEEDEHPPTTAITSATAATAALLRTRAMSSPPFSSVTAR